MPRQAVAGQPDVFGTFVDAAICAWCTNNLLQQVPLQLLTHPAARMSDCVLLRDLQASFPVRQEFIALPALDGSPESVFGIRMYYTDLASSLKINHYLSELII